MTKNLDIQAFLDADQQKDLLRILTAGSVDDGKSTLIGRLLFDSKKLYDDQLASLERDSKRMGHAGALISGGADTADAKFAIMEECGFTITRNPSEMAKLLKGLL